MRRDIYHTYAVTSDGEYLGGCPDELVRHYAFGSAKNAANRLARINDVIVCVGRYSVITDRDGMRLDNDEPATANLYVAYPQRSRGEADTYVDGCRAAQQNIREATA